MVDVFLQLAEVDIDAIEAGSSANVVRYIDGQGTVTDSMHKFRRGIVGGEYVASVATVEQRVVFVNAEQGRLYGSVGPLDGVSNVVFVTDVSAGMTLQLSVVLMAALIAFLM